jgi:hypothetical protein
MRHDMDMLSFLFEWLTSDNILSIRLENNFILNRRRRSTRSSDSDSRHRIRTRSNEEKEEKKMEEEK